VSRTEKTGNQSSILAAQIANTARKTPAKPNLTTRSYTQTSKQDYEPKPLEELLTTSMTDTYRESLLNGANMYTSYSASFKETVFEMLLSRDTRNYFLLLNPTLPTEHVLNLLKREPKGENGVVGRKLVLARKLRPNEIEYITEHLNRFETDEIGILLNSTAVERDPLTKILEKHRNTRKLKGALLVQPELTKQERNRLIQEATLHVRWEHLALSPYFTEKDVENHLKKDGTYNKDEYVKNYIQTCLTRHQNLIHKLWETTCTNLHQAEERNLLRLMLNSIKNITGEEIQVLKEGVKHSTTKTKRLLYEQVEQNPYLGEGEKDRIGRALNVQRRHRKNSWDYADLLKMNNLTWPEAIQSSSARHNADTPLHELVDLVRNSRDRDRYVRELASIWNILLCEPALYGLFLNGKWVSQEPMRTYVVKNAGEVGANSAFIVNRYGKEPYTTSYVDTGLRRIERKSLLIEARSVIRWVNKNIETETQDPAAQRNIFETFLKLVEESNLTVKQNLQAAIKLAV